MIDAACRFVALSPNFMKALLVASDCPTALALRDAIHASGIDIELVAPANVTAKSAAGHSLVVLFPSRECADVTALVAVCERLRATLDPCSTLLVAIAHDTDQLNTLVDAGADDFLLWPAETDSLSRRLDICKLRISRRERDVIRAQHLVEALREAELGEQRFRHLAESANEILTRCSRGGIRLYVSPACCQMLGYDPDELIGSSIFDVVHPADASVLRETLDQLEMGADVAGAIVRHQRRDGDFVWLELNCRPVRDRNTCEIEELITVARDITAQVHIDHDKLESEGQFELFASRAPVGIIKIDNFGNCLFINPRACELMDTTPSRAEGQGWMSLLDVRDFATLAESTIQKNIDENTYSWELAVRRPDGEKTWVAIKATSTRDRSGQGTGYVATIIDVTREQRARQELLASEERFRTIVERITEMVCRCLPDGTLTYVNEAYCRTFGQTPEDLIGKSCVLLSLPESRALFDQMIVSLSPAQPVATSIHRVVLPNGEVRWQEWYDRGTFDDEGRLVEVVGSGRDITERRTLEQKLADAGNFLRDVLDAVPDPISVEDDVNFVMVNRSFAELVGRVREGIVGYPVVLVRPDANGQNAGTWPAVSDEHEITWSTADGQLRSLFEKRAVLEDRKGHRVLVSVMRDVTERKRYEAQLALTERLASLGTLAAGIAHEINNPLSYVIGNIAFAIDSLHPSRLSPDSPQLEEIRNALSESREGAERIACIVRDVKVFSRADRDTLNLVEPCKVVEASLRMVQSNLERRATIVQEILEVPRVLANESRLTQVVVNLLMNALQALPERPATENLITIAIRVERRNVVLEVRDNGEGIPPDNLRRIFDPFFTTKSVGEGMGLGLSICNSIINAHSGRIDVVSKVGVGSAFRIIIPAAALPKSIKRLTP